MSRCTALIAFKRRSSGLQSVGYQQWIPIISKPKRERKTKKQKTNTTTLEPKKKKKKPINIKYHSYKMGRKLTSYEDGKGHSISLSKNSALSRYLSIDGIIYF